MTWIFKRERASDIPAKIHDQVVHVDDRFLCLRSSLREESVFMARMYSMGTFFLCGVSLHVGNFIEWLSKGDFEYWYFYFMFFLMSLSSVPFLFYRVLLLKKTSNYYFCRKEGVIRYETCSKSRVLDWRHVRGTVSALARPNFSLVISTPGKNGHYPSEDVFSIEGNDEPKPSIEQVSAVWEYIRQYMEYGPAGLPPPTQCKWWKWPRYQTYLTLLEAWHLYSPWPRQGKQDRDALLWTLLLPYKLFGAVSWYLMCLLFRVPKDPPVPAAVKALLPRNAKAL